MIGKRLMGLRKKRGLSQVELSTILHVSQGAISSYETGQREAPDSIKIQIAEYFDVTVDYLVGKSDFPNHSQLFANSIQILLNVPQAHIEFYDYIYYLNYKYRKEIKKLK